VTLAGITSAYGAFASNGVIFPHTLIRRVEDQDGNVLFQGEELPQQAIRPVTAYVMADMLRGVIDGGTGYGARQRGFSLPAGGKTGTTNDYKDAWFIGFTPSIVAGVWVGYDQPQPIMRRGFASVVAVPAWAAFMKNATVGSKAEWISQPAGISHIRRCRASGGLATEYCALHGEVVDDLVSIGRTPDLCTLHSSATPLTTPTLSLQVWPPRP
jgi:membrane carboxypeptidase/penicillin-binding protein